jgi:hypothetical protein
MQKNEIKLDSEDNKDVLQTDKDITQDREITNPNSKHIDKILTGVVGKV